VTALEIGQQEQPPDESNVRAKEAWKTPREDGAVDIGVSSPLDGRGTARAATISRLLLRRQTIPSGTPRRGAHRGRSTETPLRQVASLIVLAADLAARRFAQPAIRHDPHRLQGEAHLLQYLRLDAPL